MRTIALALAFFSLAATASAADYKLKKTTKAHKELVVYGYFNLKGVSICESGRPVEIDLNIPPKGGIVCMRPSMVRVEYTWSGKSQNCIGKRISGVRVIYMPFGSFTGFDTLQYTVRGGSATKTYEAEISVEADEATAAGTSSSPTDLQKAGPMPACPAFVA